MVKVKKSVKGGTKVDKFCVLSLYRGFLEHERRMLVFTRHFLRSSKLL